MILSNPTAFRSAMQDPAFIVADAKIIPRNTELEYQNGTPASLDTGIAAYTTSQVP